LSKPPTSKKIIIEDIAWGPDFVVINSGYEYGHIAHCGDLESDAAGILGVKYESCKDKPFSRFVLMIVYDATYYVAIHCMSLSYRHATRLERHN